MVLRVEPVEQEHLEALQTQLVRLPDKILEKSQLLASIERDLTRLHTHKDQLAADIEQAKQTERAASARKIVLETQDMLQQLRDRKATHPDAASQVALDATIEFQELELLAAEKAQGACQLIVSRPELEQVINQASQTRQEYEKTQRELSNTIREKERERDALGIELVGLENSRARLSANTNVMRFTEEPHKLIETLQNQVAEQINAIHKLFPAGQPERLRLVLAQLPDRLRDIYNRVPAIGLPAERAEQYRQGFYQCCGLLYEAVEFADHDNFRQRMTGLLKGYIIRRDAALQAYQKNKIDIQSAEVFDLKQYEQDAYANAAKALTDWLQGEEEDTSLKRRTQALMNAISSSENEEKFDRHYYTLFLKATLAAVANPSDQDKRDQYRSMLREMPDGKPSTVRKIVGCGLVLLGVLIFAASAVAKCLTLGIAAPITFAGMAAGGALVATGVGLFASGCARGKYKKAQALAVSLEKTAQAQKKLA